MKELEPKIKGRKRFRGERADGFKCLSIYVCVENTGIVWRWGDKGNGYKLF